MHFDPREIDLQYEPFPDLGLWKGLVIDGNRAKRYGSVLDQLKNLPKEIFLKSQNIVKRMAAIETGSIEGLYDTDRGFTFTVALQAVSWETILNSKGEETTSLIHDQLTAYDFVLDFTTKRTPISPTWIRQLHEVICASQEKYRVLTQQGWQNQNLSKGQYKILPNHVLDRNDEIHAYCPVDMVPAEMQRFCDILNSEEFQSLHPLIQAAYAHYILVYIHPFADGNGRVARALASVFTYRKYSVPILIFADEREEYFLALSEADNLQFQRFVRFISEKTFDAILIVRDSIRSVRNEDLNNTVREIEQLYITNSGYSQKEIDTLAKKLIDEIVDEFKNYITTIQALDSARFELNKANINNVSSIKENYRNLLNISGNAVHLDIATSKPENARLNANYVVFVPKDYGENDDIILVRAETHENVLEVRPKEIDQKISTQTQIRIKMFAERELSSLVKKAFDSAKQKIGQQ